MFCVLSSLSDELFQKKKEKHPTVGEELNISPENMISKKRYSFAQTDQAFMPFSVLKKGVLVKLLD